MLSTHRKSRKSEVASNKLADRQKPAVRTGFSKSRRPIQKRYVWILMPKIQYRILSATTSAPSFFDELYLMIRCWPSKEKEVTVTNIPWFLGSHGVHLHQLLIFAFCVSRQTQITKCWSSHQPAQASTYEACDRITYRYEDLRGTCYLPLLPYHPSLVYK